MNAWNLKLKQVYFCFIKTLNYDDKMIYVLAKLDPVNFSLFKMRNLIPKKPLVNQKL